MKSIITGLIAIALLSFSSLNLAADPVAGEKVFNTNCSGCHKGGGNLLNQEKTLKTSDLEKNAVNSAAAIMNQVTQGKPPMPAFGKSLSPADIENVAAFVLKKAAVDWK